MHEVEESNDTEDASPAKKRRSVQLPHSYKKAKAKLDFEGKEIYLIRAPADFDMHKLDGKKISLNAGTHHICCGEGTDFVADITVDDIKNPLLVAQSTDGSLVKGTICIRQNVLVPDPILPVATEGNVNRLHFTDNLKQRYVPFGAVNMNERLSPQSKVQQRKRKKKTSH